MRVQLRRRHNPRAALLPSRTGHPAATGASRLVPGMPLATLALTAMLACTADAAQQWFTVEIVVFDDPRSLALHDEHWPPDPGEPSLEGAVELTVPIGEEPDGGVPHAFRLLDRSELSLSGAWDALRRSARHRPLLHAGWRLPGVRPGAARPAHLGVSLAAPSGGGSGGGPPSVHGTVKISLVRYLHVEIDLLYSRFADGAVAASDGTPARFRLEAQRRMRSGELHYIDHPLFGVLMRVTPFLTASSG